MKNPTDQLGNELHEGQQVVIHIPQSAMLDGVVTKVSPGGLSVAAAPNGRRDAPTMPALVVIQVAFPMQVPPGSPIPGIVCVIDPRSQSLVEHVAAEKGTDRPQ